MLRFLIAGMIGASLLLAVLAEALLTPQTTSWPALFALPILLAVLRLSPRAVIGVAALSLSSYIGSSWLLSGSAFHLLAVNSAAVLAVAVLGYQVAQRQYEMTAAHARLAMRDQELEQRISMLAARDKQVQVSLDETPVSVFGQDQRLRYTWTINPPRSWGGQTLIGKSDTEIFVPEDAARLQEIKHGVVEHGLSARHQLELTANGQSATYDLSLHPVRATDQTIVGVTGIAVDISRWVTARDHLRQRLEREQAERFRAEAEQHRLRRLYHRVHQFVASVAHELSQPLTTILGAAQRLERIARTRLGESETRMVRMIVDAGHRAHRMVQDLRAMSTVETGTFDVQPTQMDLVEAVQQLVAELPESDRKRIVVTAPDSVTGSWDHDRIMQVMTNLISNALKYSDASSAVHVGIRQEDDAAFLSVRDEGPGIAPEDQERVFEASTRLDGTAHVQGSGLGLYIARRIVEAHGGRIWVESASGHGSTFNVSLPVATV